MFLDEILAVLFDSLSETRETDAARVAGFSQTWTVADVFALEEDTVSASGCEHTDGFAASSLMVAWLTSKALDGSRRDNCGVAGLDYRQSKAMRQRRSKME